MGIETFEGKTVSRDKNVYNEPQVPRKYKIPHHEAVAVFYIELEMKSDFL